MKTIEDAYLKIDRELWDKYQSENLKEGTNLCTSFLKDCLENTEFYNYILSKFQNPNTIIGYKCEETNDSFSIEKIKKAYFFRRLSNAIETNSIKLSEVTKSRFATLKTLIGLESLQTAYANHFLNYQETKVSIKDMLGLLSLPKTKIQEIFAKHDFIYGIPADIFLKLTTEFFIKYQIENNYILPQEITENLHFIRAYELLDFEHLMKDFDNNPIIEEVSLDEGLARHVLNSVDKNATDIEKVVQVYLKLCETLSYDDEYFAVDQHGPLSEKHRNLSNVSKINLANKEVVCYEFAIIFSKLLHLLGIKSKVAYHGEYGQSHTNVLVNIGKYIIEADPVTNILGGDLYRAKIKKELTGLASKNLNSETAKELNLLLIKAYKDYYHLKYDEPFKTFKELELADIIEKYEKVANPKIRISLEQRLNILVKKVTKSTMQGVDAMSYILDLLKVLFSYSERGSNIDFLILRNNESEEKASSIGIFTINEKGFVKHPKASKYYIYIPQKAFTEIPKGYLSTLIDTKRIEYRKPEPKIIGL